MASQRELTAEEWQKAGTLMVLVRGGVNRFDSLQNALEIEDMALAWLIFKLWVFGFVTLNLKKQIYTLSLAGRDQIKLITPAVRVNGHLEHW